jgi:hypothetical protein
LTLTTASLTATLRDTLLMLSLYSPSAGAATRTPRNVATPLRSLVRLLPLADTRAAMLPSLLKALPDSSTCCNGNATMDRQQQRTFQRGR